MVTSDAVEQTCANVGEYSEQEMASEFERFFKAQPELCDFIVELTGESDQKIQELSLYLSYMVFKAVERCREEMPSVNHLMIEEAFRESERWIEKLNQVENTAVQKTILSSFESESEPFLLQYVIAEINQALEDGTELGDEQKGEIFFVLKTVISTLVKETV
jgi:hypothetical protein